MRSRYEFSDFDARSLTKAWRVFKMNHEQVDPQTLVLEGGEPHEVDFKLMTLTGPDKSPEAIRQIRKQSVPSPLALHTA